MPAIVGTVNINSVGGIFNIGDVQIISPRSTLKTFAGGGSFNTGTNLNINNKHSVTRTYDADAYDQNIVIPEDPIP
jgi:spore germination protein PA